MRPKTMANAFYNWLGARRKKNEVKISKAEWIQWWEETGHYQERGTLKHQYCMKRIDTSLPFSIENIMCIQNKERYNKGE